MSNLKPGPIFLTPELTAKLVGDRPAYGKGIAHLPFGQRPLVDRPQRGRDNDNG
ncbi:MAG: hypothetical protein IE933_03420 [Sphingomonadales bacterium]|nr:hypothetical protein [Sphingomonadales bacterium]MBD3772091.1 hypothetical protein [Paracoccaceae bacterium]